MVEELVVRGERRFEGFDQSGITIKVDREFLRDFWRNNEIKCDKESAINYEHSAKNRRSQDEVVK